MIKWIIIAVVFGFVGSTIAKTKGRDRILWFVLCTLIPLLVIAIFMLPAIAAKGRTKECPLCAEAIQEDVKFCKHCGMSNLE